METQTFVTGVRTQTDLHGLDVEITVRRDWRVPVGEPSVDDVPADVRRALRAWLNEEEDK